MNRSAALMLAGTLAGCSIQTQPLLRPADGYEALRVREAFRVPQVGFAELDFPAGQIFTADRAVNGEPIYCGTVYASDFLASVPVRTCATFRDDTMQLHVQTAMRGQPFPIPPGAIERVRVR